MREYYNDDKDDYYDREDWKETEKEIKEKNEKKVRTRLLTVIQITVCSILLMTALFLKFSGSNAYAVIKGWYLTSINQTIIPDERIENVKNRVIELFPAPSSQPAASRADSAPPQSTAPQSGAVQSTLNSQSGANSQNAVNSQNAAESRQTVGAAASDNTQLLS
jgi:hypothetical protein